MTEPRDHGGGIDAAISRFGGTRAGWLDLSTGINPTAYPLPEFSAADWTQLPDAAAFAALYAAARRFWSVPDNAAILAAPGASSLIARLPGLVPVGAVQITPPTYNEHAAAFSAQGWKVGPDPAPVRVIVHPNNPDGHLWTPDPARSLLVIDESFCDTRPDASLIGQTSDHNTLILKSFGKFWGLAGLRLGFAIGSPDLIAKLGELTGPWAISGPALRTATKALSDPDWAAATRHSLSDAAARLDALLERSGATIKGGTSLFRLAETADAPALWSRLAAQHILTRTFPYSSRWIRFGLPGRAADWARLETALLP